MTSNITDLSDEFGRNRLLYSSEQMYMLEKVASLFNGTIITLVNDSRPHMSSPPNYTGRTKAHLYTL